MIDPLPPNDHEFWKGADIELMKSPPPKDHVHCFKGKGSGPQVKCSCGIGYILSPGMSIKDGHIYAGMHLVI